MRSFSSRLRMKWIPFFFYYFWFPFECLPVSFVSAYVLRMNPTQTALCCCTAHRYHTDYSPLLFYEEPWLICFCLSISFALTSSADSVASCYTPAKSNDSCPADSMLLHTAFSFDMRLLSVIFSIYPQTAHLDACDLHLKWSDCYQALFIEIQHSSSFPPAYRYKKKACCTIQTFFLNCLLKQLGLPCRSLIMQRDRYFLHPLS